MPFTTPALAQARARKDNRGKLELLVPAFAAARGTYVIRWRDLPAIFNGMTVHDRALHEQIDKVEASTPHEVRHAALVVARTGLAGPMAAKTAEDFLNAEGRERVMSTYMQVNFAAEQLNGSRLENWNIPAAVGDLMTDERQKDTREAIGGVAARLGSTPEIVYTVVEQWGDIVNPIGVPEMPRPCRLRRLAEELRSFAGELKEWAERDQSECSELARIIATTLLDTVKFAVDMMSRADARSKSVKGTFFDWEAARVALKTDADRVSWTLDGWEFIVLLWRQAQPQSREDQRRAIAEIFRILPFIPEQEMKDEMTRTSQPGKGWGRYIRAMHDWVTGSVDQEMVYRLEKLKLAQV